MQKENLSCNWQAVELDNYDYKWRNLKATFDSEEDANEFFASYTEAVGYAAHSCDVLKNALEAKCI